MNGHSPAGRPARHRTPRRWLLGVALALPFALAGACRSEPRHVFSVEDYPGVLRRPEALGRDVLWRQHVVARWGEGESRGFGGVVQTSGDTLTVLALSPAGSVGFSAVLHGGEVELENHMSAELPFDPRCILLDVQRAFYPWLTDDVRRTDGVYEADVDGEHIVETWEAGLLVERTFARLEGEPGGEIRIHYRWDNQAWEVPSETVLDNGWFGYQLSIETLEEIRIGPPGCAP